MAKSKFMKNLAPHILIEGLYKILVDKKVINKYFQEITKALQLRIYGEPIIFSPSGSGKQENQGYDAFVPQIDSGISLYIWSNARFLSEIIYTCKGFDENTAIEVTNNFFEIDKVESQSF